MFVGHQGKSMLERLIESGAELSGLFHGKLSWFKSSHWTLLTHHLFHFVASKWCSFVLEHLVWWKLASQAVSWKFQKNMKRVRFAHTIILSFRYQRQRDKYANISICSTITMHCLGARNSTNIAFGAQTWWWREEVKKCFIWSWISFVLCMLSQYY